MTTFPMLPDVGRVSVPVRPTDESEFVDRVKTLLGNRIRSSVPTKQHEAEFRRFQAWALAFGYRELPAHGAVVAGYLMAIMSEIGCLNQVREAGRAVASVHAARGLYLDDRYLKAAIAWAKDFRAGGECV